MSTSTSEQERQMSDASEARKFLFDLSFDEETNLALPAQPKPKVSYTEEELDGIKKVAYDSGFAAGKNDMLESQQQQMNQLLSEVDIRLTTLFKNTGEKWSDFLIQLQKITLVILRKILPSYVEKNGADEIDAIVSKTIAEMNQEPRLVIRVAESQFEEANTRINILAKNQAYAGKIVLLSDENLVASDCRIEWADGGVELNQEKIWEDVSRIIDAQQLSCPPSVSQMTKETPIEVESETPLELQEKIKEIPSTTQQAHTSQPETKGEKL